jgi:hypothetical protein
MDHVSGLFAYDNCMGAGKGLTIRGTPPQTDIMVTRLNLDFPVIFRFIDQIPTFCNYAEKAGRL